MLGGGAGDALESTTCALIPKLHWEWHTPSGGAEDGVSAEAEEEGEGVASKGGFSGAGAPPEEASSGEEGGAMCEVGETRATADETTSAGLLDAAGSAGGLRPEGGRLTESSLRTKVQAGGLTLGLLLFLRFSRTPWLRLVCSWSKARSSRRWVRASFCWIAMRRREFRVFFSSSAAASCLCISSSWVTYSSHLGEENERKQSFNWAPA